MKKVRFLMEDDIPAIAMFCIAKHFAEARKLPFFTLREQYKAIRLYEVVAGGFYQYESGLN